MRGHEELCARKKNRIIFFLCMIVLLVFFSLSLVTRPRNTELSARTRTVLESGDTDSFLLRYEFGERKALEYTIAITKKSVSDDTALLDIVLNQGDSADFSIESLCGSLRSSSDAVISNIFVSGGAGIYTVPEVWYPDRERTHGFSAEGYFHLTALVSGSEVSLELSVTARENAVFFPEHCTVTESFAVLG